MSTLTAISARVTSVTPFATIIALAFGFVQGFCYSLRLAIEGSSEIDHTNRLTACGYVLIDVKKS